MNIIILWNTLYINAALEQLASDGYSIRQEDLTRLSPLVFDYINLVGRYNDSRDPAVATARVIAREPSPPQSSPTRMRGRRTFVARTWVPFWP